MDVEIKFKQGPVVVNENTGQGINNEYPLWNEIIGNEHFPATKESASYQLTLRKKVESHDEVEKTEEELIDALSQLSYVWPFAGGSVMTPEVLRLQYVPSFESNAAEVKKHLLGEANLKRVTRDACFPFEITGTYLRFPLKPAIELCSKSKEDVYLQMLFEYYRKASTDPFTWFIALYNIRDVLKYAFDNSSKKTKNTLSINEKEWKYFGRVLNNNNLRHPPISKASAKSINNEEVNKVKKLGFKWINAYLNYKGIDI
jgi:hypothetical protein